jgi:hypothetical protein
MNRAMDSLPCRMFKKTSGKAAVSEKLRCTLGGTLRL